MVEKDLARIRQLAEKKSGENWEFRAFLKRCCNLSSEEIDRLTHKLYNEIASAIDCKECGNCCRETRPVLNSLDIERLAKELNISVVQFKERYLSKCEEGGLWFKTTPCPFLRDNKCSQYSFRPEVCESFPHLHKKDFTSRLINVVDNYSICPIVFNVYEGLKSKLWRAQKEEI